MYEFIDKLMQERGITLYKLSKDTGIPYSTLATCKKKGTKLGLDKVQTIADYFGVTVDYLMGKQGNGYYINDETAKMAQTLPGLRLPTCTGGNEHRLQITESVQTHICKHYPFSA